MDKNEAKIIFGQNLKRLRIANGMSQDELSRRLGYTNRSSINKIELGKNDMPRNKVALAAQVLGVSPLDLFAEAPLVDFEIKPIMMEKLTEANKLKMLAYYQGLLDSQEEDDGNT